MLRAFLHFALILLIPAATLAQDEAPKKVVKRIVEEVEIVLSLYAQGEPAVKFKALPRFSMVKLANYAAAKNQTAESEREAWKKDRATYGKDFPLRALIFEAAEETARVPRLATEIPHPLTPKAKAEFFQNQQALGMALFKLEEQLTRMQEADRTKETSKRWLADFEFARARMLGNVMYLYEYNYLTGQIRADNLPELTDQHDGWRLSPRPKLHVTETKPKVFAKERGKLLQKLQEEHAGTPWAHFAEKESRGEVGLAWEPRKK